jgi:hypothetical protein
MPEGERIALVACQACRTRKSRVSLLYRASFNVRGRAQSGYCDGMTPVCGPCQAKHTYSSDHTFSRFTTLKSEYEQLKSSYGNLYERLKHRSASEVSELLEQIRSENEIPGLLEDRAYSTGLSMILSWKIITLDP